MRPALFVLACPLLFLVSVYSKTIHVPGDYPTIQQAIDASVNGDSVLVDPGTYVENIDFLGKSILVTSTGGASDTTIDGKSNGSVIVFENNEGKDSVLDGFTITNGSGMILPHYPPHLFGGGIYCEEASPIISNNMIIENEVHGEGTYFCSGGGIYCKDSSPEILCNNISDNYVDGSSCYGGAGIFCQGGNPNISNNIISKNKSPYGTISDGGGLYISGSGALVKNNAIFDNEAKSGGGGIYCGNSDNAVFTDNLIYNNYSQGGVAFRCDNSSCLITNNIIYGNVTKSGGVAGAIYIARGTPTISYNEIFDNTAYTVGGIFTISSSAVIMGNRIYENIATDGTGGAIDCSGMNGSVYPLLVNNIIYKNTAEYGGGIRCIATESSIVNNLIYGNTATKEGGGINSFYDDNSKIINTILWDNSSPSGQELYLASSSKPAIITISHSDVKGGLTSVFIGKDCILNWESGMIDADPMFLDAANDDYHLSCLSPCINRGTNENAPSEDIDGDPRPYMGTVDMGADEFIGTHPLEADIFTISESGGGIINFTINGGAANAGRNYLIYGTISGTAPGTPLPGGFKILPINWDLFTNIVADVNYPDSIIFTGFFGTLNPGGQMDAVFDTNGPVPGMAGYTVSFAYPLQGPPWDFVSNPVNIEVVQ